MIRSQSNQLEMDCEQQKYSALPNDLGVIVELIDLPFVQSVPLKENPSIFKYYRNILKPQLTLTCSLPYSTDEMGFSTKNIFREQDLFNTLASIERNDNGLFVSSIFQRHVYFQYELADFFRKIPDKHCDPSAWCNYCILLAMVDLAFQLWQSEMFYCAEFLFADHLKVIPEKFQGNDYKLDKFTLELYMKETRINLFSLLHTRYVGSDLFGPFLKEFFNACDAFYYPSFKQDRDRRAAAREFVKLFNVSKDSLVLLDYHDCLFNVNKT